MTDGTDTEIWVEEYLSSLLDLARLDVSIEELSLDDEGNLVVQLAGPDSARAIGREGQMLDAIQHMAVTAAIHAGVSKRRIVVDVEGYRERREQKLREDATFFAEEVLSTGNPYDFVPMSPRERRLVHMTVSEIEGVSTESFGMGDERYVRIVPS